MLSFFCAAHSLWACPHATPKNPFLQLITLPGANMHRECSLSSRVHLLKKTSRSTHSWPSGARLLYEWVSFTLSGRYLIRTICDGATSSQGHVSLYKKLPADHDFAKSPGQSTRFRTGGSSQVKRRDLSWSELVQQAKQRDPSTKMLPKVHKETIPKTWRCGRRRRAPSLPNFRIKGGHHLTGIAG